MKESPYFFEVKDVMTQFVAAFNDVIIKRHDRERNVKSKVKVRYVYAPKQRVIHDLTNKARHLTLPVVAVNMSGISRDQGRVFNKIHGAYMSEFERNINATSNNSAATSYNIPQPVPVNISVNMSIMARYQTDIEQIISNFVPYNDPYIIISWKLPKQFFPKDMEIRSEVLWSGDLNIDYPEALNNTDPFRLSCDTSFTIKTWLFKSTPETTKNIYKITTNMTPVDDITSDMKYILPYYDEVTERSYLESFGPPLTAAPHITHVGNDTVLGYNFARTTSVYISASNVNSVSGTSVDMFDGEMQKHFPQFVGVPIEFEIINDNQIKYFLPEIDSDLTGDLIIQNAGGYSTAISTPDHGKVIPLK
jgi:hypothetical protein